MTVRIIDAEKTLAFDMKEAIKCISNNSKYHVKGVEIHHGTYGRVYGVCMVEDKHDVDCKQKVVKIIFFPADEDEALQKREVENLMREIYIFHKLNTSGISPRIFDAFGCGNYFNIVLERFGLNMWQVGREQVKSFEAQFAFALFRNRLPSNFFGVQKETLVYSDFQMRRLFDIAKELGSKYGVIHGDLRPDQYLYQVGANVKKLAGSEKNKIVVSDFGFSGTSTIEPGKWRAELGWHFQENCGALFQPLPPVTDENNKERVLMYRNYYNIFQLWFYFSFHFSPVFVLKNSNLYVFPHHRQAFTNKDSPYYVPDEAWKLFTERTDCGGLNETYPYWHYLDRVVPSWTA